MFCALLMLPLAMDGAYPAFPTSRVGLNPHEAAFMLAVEDFVHAPEIPAMVPAGEIAQAFDLLRADDWRAREQGSAMFREAMKKDVGAVRWARFGLCSRLAEVRFRCSNLLRWAMACVRCDGTGVILHDTWEEGCPFCDRLQVVLLTPYAW
jgi:hypothetical protein